MIKKIIPIFLLLGGIFASDLQAQSVDAQISSISKLNDKVNDAITKREVYSHRVTLNSFSQIWPGLSKYKETFDCYFTVSGNEITLKKIIVLSEIANRQTYSDYLFDADGNAVMVLIDQNAVEPTSDKGRYYFMDRKMIHMNVNGEGVYAEDFSTEDMQVGVDVFNKAIIYRNMFDSMVASQMLNR